MDTSVVARWVKKFRILTLALIFSGALNIGFIASFIFSAMRDRQESLSIALPGKGEQKVASTVEQVLAHMGKLSFHELVPYLTNKEWVEQGLAKRDLALACLASFHYFNLEKALSGLPQQRRSISLSADTQVEVYLGLNEQQFEAILRFAYEEKWPLTAKGLAAFLKKFPEERESSLVQAFCVTPEFHFLQTLFQKTNTPQDPALLVQLAIEGDWELLARFAREQSEKLDLTIEKRRSLLREYLAQKSPTAALLWLATDASFAAKKFEDQQVIDLIQLLNQKTPEAEKLCLELLRSPRSDAVWQSAVLRLYTYTGEPLPSPFDLKTAIARFLPSAPEQVAPQPIAASPSAARSTYIQHVVKDGENLWKIAKNYKVRVDDIVKCNDLEKDLLYPGMMLRIPSSPSPHGAGGSQGTGSQPPR